MVINQGGDVEPSGDVCCTMADQGQCQIQTAALRGTRYYDLTNQRERMEDQVAKQTTVDFYGSIHKSVLVNVTGGPDLSLTDVDEAVGVVHEAAGPDANIIFGTVIDESLGGQVRVTVIATGLADSLARRPRVSRSGRVRRSG